MSVAGMPQGSLRQERVESTRLVWAFVISMLLHLFIFGGYETGKKLNWWENARWPAWLSPVKKLADALKKKEYPAFVASTGANDKLFHVQLGPYSDVKDAEGMRTKLIGDGYNPILKK